jgi:hypothetical protein
MDLKQCVINGGIRFTDMGKGDTDCLKFEAQIETAGSYEMDTKVAKSLLENMFITVIRQVRGAADTGSTKDKETKKEGK